MMEVKIEVKGLKVQGKGGSLGDKIMLFELDDLSIDEKCPEATVESLVDGIKKMAVLSSI